MNLLRSRPFEFQAEKVDGRPPVSCFDGTCRQHFDFMQVREQVARALAHRFPWDLRLARRGELHGFGELSGPLLHALFELGSL